MEFINGSSKGKLYVIGTPIGNLGDITLRAIEKLAVIEVLYCEDSRVAAKLINRLIEKGLVINKPRYVAYNEFNENRVWKEVVNDVKSGKLVGLISDAGMPAISDPGYRAVRGCLDENLPLEVIPGPTALTTALPYSGIGGEVALYFGFLPKSAGKAAKLITAAKDLCLAIPTARLVFYVSPHRLNKDLELIREIMGEVNCVMLRELTKQYEERIEANITKLIEQYQNKKAKGELVLVVGMG